MALPFYYNPVTNELESTIESLGTRFGLEEISIARNTLSPTKSYTEGGRIGFGSGTPLYTATAENFEFLDNLILNTKKTLNEIKSAFGGEPTSGNQGINKLIESWAASSKDRVLPKDRFKYYKFTADSPKVKEVIALFESGMSKKAIEFKTGISRKEIRKIFHQFKPEYIGEENLPSGEGKNAVKKRRLKLIKEYTDYWKNKSGGEKILEELNQKLRSIKLKNAEILTMSDEAILNNKVFKEAMNLDVKGLKIGEGINFKRYAKLTDAEYIAKVKAMAKTNQFYQPEHLIAINKKNPASMLPKNIYTAVGKVGSQLEVLKEHLKNNPDVKITDEIKALLKNQNISLPKSETIGSKALDIAKVAGSKIAASAPWRAFERSLMPFFSELHYVIAGEWPDPTKTEELLLPSFWNSLMKKYNWGHKSSDPLRRKLLKFLKRGLIPTSAMPYVSKIATIALIPAELYQATKTATKTIPDKEKEIAQWAEDNDYDPEKAVKMYWITHDQPKFTRETFYKPFLGMGKVKLGEVQELLKDPQYEEIKKSFDDEFRAKYFKDKGFTFNVMEGSVIDKEKEPQKDAAVDSYFMGGIASLMK